MRLFLAIELPEIIKNQISQSITVVRREYPQFNWVPPENYHITIHFFGEIDDDVKIKEGISNVLFDRDRFYLYSNFVDLFINNKIVIYLDFRREKNLEKIAEDITGRFQQPEDIHKKKFVPHLTLARYKIPSKQQYFVLKKRLAKLDIDIEFPVDKLVLYQSILTEEKPIYKKLEEFPLI